jgi:drug/metabolite transporter, DME family
MLRPAMEAVDSIELGRRQRRAGAVLVILAAALWSTGGVGVKVADAEPLVIAGLRSVFALAFMTVVLLVTMRRAGLRAGDVGALLRRPLVWAAAASYALMVTMFVLSARKTTAANAIFIQYTGPVYVALLSGKLLGEKVTRRDVVAVGFCVVGMALAFGGELGGGKMSGNLLAILSSFGFAGLPLLLRLDQRALGAHVRGAEQAPLVAMSLGNAIAALVALPAMIASPPSGPHQARTLIVLMLLGTLQIGLPYVLYAMAVRRLRALESSLLATVEPVLAPVWVVLATGETPSTVALAGGAVIVLAVAGQATRPRASG